MGTPQNAPTTPLPAGARGRFIGLMPDALTGMVVAGSILAVASLRGIETGRVALVAVAVGLVYWLDHVYTDAVGGRFLDPDNPTHVRLRRALRSHDGMILGSLPPVAIYLVVSLVGLGPQTAAWVALWLTVALLAGTGFAAAWSNGARGRLLTTETLVAGSIGLFIIGLKYLMK